MGSYLDLEDLLGLKIHRAKRSCFQKFWQLYSHILVHMNQLHDKTQLLMIGNVLDLLWLIKIFCFSVPAVSQICMVTRRSSTITSFVKKSAPMVALYWLLNFLFTYWFIREVLPTPP